MRQAIYPIGRFRRAYTLKTDLCGCDGSICIQWICNPFFFVFFLCWHEWTRVARASFCSNDSLQLTMLALTPANIRLSWSKDGTYNRANDGNFDDPILSCPGIAKGHEGLS